MKKTVRTIAVGWMRRLLLAILLSILSLNLSTLCAVSYIKQGGHVELGYFSAIIGSGSMQPALSVNDFLLVKSTPHYQRGDIVTYVSPQGSLVTHRILEVLMEGYIVQGDANNMPDEMVLEQQILGKVGFAIPGVGKVMRAMLSPSGIIFLLGFPVFLWLSKR